MSHHPPASEHDLEILSHRPARITPHHLPSPARRPLPACESPRRAQHSDLEARLACPMSAALVQAVALTGEYLQADIAAARIYNLASNLHDHYVWQSRPLADDDIALRNWPHAQPSVFHLLHRVPVNRVLTLPQLARALALPAAPANLWAGLRVRRQPQDALALLLPLLGQCRIAIILLRCQAYHAFTSDDHATFDSLRPALAESLSRAQGQRDDLKTSTWSHLPPPPTRTVVVNRLLRLSRMERRVLRLLRRGCTERRVAQQLNRSPHTVHVHVKNIYRKMDVNCRAQLLALFDIPAPAFSG